MMATDPISPKDRSTTTAPLRILVADDEALVAAEIAGMLREIGHTVAGCVADGQAAAAAARGGEVDLVLMDINMPGRSGLSAAAEIGLEHGIPVVMLTAYADRALVEDAQQAGAFGYIVKPAPADQLRVAIDIAHAQWARTKESRAEAVELTQKLEDRKLAERAKWQIVKRYRVSETEAWELLQKASRATRVKLAGVARGVLESGELPGAPSVKRLLWNARKDENRDPRR